MQSSIKFTAAQNLVYPKEWQIIAQHGYKAYNIGTCYREESCDDFLFWINSPFCESITEFNSLEEVIKWFENRYDFIDKAILNL